MTDEYMEIITDVLCNHKIIKYDEINSDSSD